MSEAPDASHRAPGSGGREGFGLRGRRRRGLRGNGLAAGGCCFALQHPDLAFEVVEPEHEPIEALDIALAVPIAAVDEETQVASDGVALPADPHELDLRSAFVERSLCTLAEGLQLLVESINEGRHVPLLTEENLRD
jgi:hypothetical protein